MSAETPYVPIACAFHESLEFAVLRRARLRLRYRGEDGAPVEALVLPTDVATRDGAEWLSYRAEDGAMGVLRLDCLLGAEPVSA